MTINFDEIGKPGYFFSCLFIISELIEKLSKDVNSSPLIIFVFLPKIEYSVIRIKPSPHLTNNRHYKTP